MVFAHVDDRPCRVAADGERIAVILEIEETESAWALGQRWRCKAVRDLAWVIGSPPLVCPLTSEALWPDAQWCERQLERMLPVLDELDEARWQGREEFSAQADRRLGAWFEFLIQRWFELDDRYELLARGVALRAPLTGGGSETVGELDFVVRDLEAQQVEHWEVAVKFYLGGVSGSAGAWLGPGLRDRLDKKLARLKTHQLPLAATKLARTTLAEQGLVVDRSRAFVKGRLFYPLAAPAAPPPEAGTPHLRGWWLSEDDFPGVLSDKAFGWRLLEAGDRLAERVAGDKDRTAAEISAALSADGGLTRARLLAAFDGGREISRGYVVPRQWHTLAEQDRGKHG